MHTKLSQCRIKTKTSSSHHLLKIYYVLNKCTRKEIYTGVNPITMYIEYYWQHQSFSTGNYLVMWDIFHTIFLQQNHFHSKNRSLSLLTLHIMIAQVQSSVWYVKTCKHRNSCKNNNSQLLLCRKTKNKCWYVKLIMVSNNNSLLLQYLSTFKKKLQSFVFDLYTFNTLEY